MSVKERYPEYETNGKKSTYSEGFAPKEFKLSGVKKLILLLVSLTIERHDNMSALLGELGIDAVDFGLCCDLKIVLILTGKQSASSKHCCPFCLASSTWLGSFPNTTVGGQWECYNAYVEAGSNLRDAKKFYNVVNPPLITGETDDKIL